jgi:VanZ family protein
MMVIFYFSSRPRFGITHQFIFDFIILKTLHMIEYGILYFLIFRALHQTSQLSLTKKFLYSFFLAFLYAVSDEIHQSFIPSREAKIGDIIIDTIGISFAYYFIKIKKAVFYEKV